MAARTGYRVTSALAAALLLGLVLVSYRARTFHYCATTGPRPEARVAAGEEPCRPDEEPLETGRLGWPGKIKLAAKAAAKVCGAD